MSKDDISYETLFKSTQKEYTDKLSSTTGLVIKSGIPLFKADEILKTPNPVARLLRMVCVDKVITLPELQDAHTQYGIVYEGKHLTATNTDRNNHRRALLRDRVTVDLFEKFLIVMGLKVVDLAYTLEDIRTGETKTYQISEIQEIVNKHLSDYTEDTESAYSKESRKRHKDSDE